MVPCCFLTSAKYISSPKEKLFEKNKACAEDNCITPHIKTDPQCTSYDVFSVVKINTKRKTVIFGGS